MDAYECICSRHSVRSYDIGREMSEEQLEKILICGRAGAKWRQWAARFFYVVRNQQIIERMRAVWLDGWDEVFAEPGFPFSHLC